MNYLKEYKIAIIKMISELQKTMHELNEDINKEVKSIKGTPTATVEKVDSS